MAERRGSEKDPAGGSRHAELLSELREIRHQTDSIPKKWELLVAYVILGAVGAIFILRDIIVWLFLH
jgi:hypothetical protein